MNENKLINEGISYEFIKRMEQHAKQYDYVSDKKDFLRNVSPYEQKMILLNSRNPYEVLNYLDELDIKVTREILNELTYDEIKKVLSLFSSEDKKNFYKHYSDLGLVNQFIAHDKNALKYIDDLTFDRKVNLIDSSNSKTIQATSKVYETMSGEQREAVSDFVTESSAISTLSAVETQAENNISNEVIEDNKIDNDDLDQALKQEVDEQVKDELEEKIEEEKQQEKEEEKMEVKPEQQETEINNMEVQNNSELEVIDSFQKIKQENEIEFINKIKSELIITEQKEQILDNNENQKIL